MKHFQDLDILSFVGLKNASRDDMPSWVPLWDEDLAISAILGQFGRWNWKADGATRQEIQVNVYNDSLVSKVLYSIISLGLFS